LLKEAYVNLGDCLGIPQNSIFMELSCSAVVADELPYLRYLFKDRGCVAR